MLPRLLAFALLLPLAAAASPVPVCGTADPAALELLAKIADRAGTVPFEGVVTLQRGGSVRMMNVRHGVAGDLASERLTLLTGQEAQVVRGDHPLDCEHPGHRLLRLAAATEAEDCGVAAHYRLATAPGERIAGRRAVRLLLEPRDLYRYGYVFEVDRETALLLKGTTIGPGGRPLEQFQFASLTLDTGRVEEPGEGVVHRAAHPHPDAAAGNGRRRGVAWTPGWLPPGFVATDAAGARSGRQSYTDGMATFSVFLEKLSRPMHPGEGIVREGSTVSYTRGIRLAGDAVLVTVLGEIPVNTARMVADAVRPAS